MEKKPLSLDELFEEQSLVPFLCTIEKVKDNDTVIKITPWKKNSGCFCELSIQVSRDAIEAVYPTGDFHYCCEKRLHVLEIKFRENSSITLKELFTQLIEKISSPSHHQHDNYSRPFDLGENFSNYYTEAFPSKSYQDTYYSSELQTQYMFCGGTPCGPGNTCLNCGGRFWCVQRGSSCCHGSPCPPGNTCLNCGGRFSCVQSGSSCCHGNPCPPGNVCLNCGGRFWCVPRGSSCFNGQIVPSYN